MRLRRWRKVNTWSIKGPLLVVALLLGFFDHSLHWGGAAFAAGIAVVLPIIGFREFWSEWRFWAALSALALLQLPLVLAVRAFVDKPGFPPVVRFNYPRLHVRDFRPVLRLLHGRRREGTGHGKTITVI
jgi:hypothetical protein